MTLPLTVLLGACGGDEAGQTDERPVLSTAEAATALHEAQPLHVRDVTLISDGSESGTYSELVTVRYSDEVRASTELDKPECLDAANQWGDLEGVREAPASVAAYEWSQGAVTHMLVRVDEATAEEVLSTEPPENCTEYTAIHEDGSSSAYGVSTLDGVPQIGDRSRALAIEVESAGERSRMVSLMYRNGDLVGTTSILGTGEPADYEEMLVEFSEAAVERQRQMLG
ncbi:hypothetical protein [Nocardiopsis sp. ATB16-24]|uniref:hypothetical protein n=1 Tax=Nocardiopsis sp. ATB16-24 TaxID=3019555 RepID=UPI00255741BF|nr:hypothetical protein [Nocardiopsis sp. ATB16-24]